MMVRQFREWLTNTGPYSIAGTLQNAGDKDPLPLKDLAIIAGNKKWKSVNQIDPPRGTPKFDDPWQQKWIQFKRHVVAQHYEDLATWAVEAGLSRSQIFTSTAISSPDMTQAVATNTYANHTLVSHHLSTCVMLI
jgi:hypothetical protein